jgi:hypothetical protein
MFGSEVGEDQSIEINKFVPVLFVRLS